MVAALLTSLFPHWAITLLLSPFPQASHPTGTGPDAKDIGHDLTLSRLCKGRYSSANSVLVSLWFKGLCLQASCIRCEEKGTIPVFPLCRYYHYSLLSNGCEWCLLWIGNVSKREQALSSQIVTEVKANTSLGSEAWLSLICFVVANTSFSW